MLWLALAVMTGVAIFIALWPLAFRRGSTADEGREAAFYRAQLAEIARDVDRGLLPEGEAAAARAEAGRRLIVASAEVGTAVSGSGETSRRRIAAFAILVLTPVLALSLYGLVGQPQLPDLPLAARKTDATAPEALEAALARIEAHLRTSPDDKRVWAGIAPVYMRLGRFDDAAEAYRQLVRLEGPTGPLLAALGEALVAANGGIVTTSAREQFDKALAASPGLPMARFYVGLAAEQDGKPEEAKTVYNQIAPEAKGNQPWMIGLRARLAALDGGSPAEQADAAAPPKSAPSFTPEQRVMIQGMVQGLASRLAQGGGSAQEWARLIRAYSVLQEPDKAKDALASARKALGPNADIDALARELGI